MKRKIPEIFKSSKRYEHLSAKDMQVMDGILNRMDELGISLDDLASLTPEEWEQLGDDEEDWDDGLDEEDSATLNEEEIKNIFINNWNILHPDDVKCPSDTFYGNLNMEIFHDLCKLRLPPHFPASEVFGLVSSTAAAYLEDVVSGLGVWSAIRDGFREKYGETLPFFDCDHEDYFDDEINIEDVKFLVWQSLSRVGYDNGVFYSPYSELVSKVAEIVFRHLEDNFETAPEAVRVRDYVRRALKDCHYYKIREIAINLVMRNPLTAIYGIDDDIMNNVNQMHESLKDGLAVTDDILYYYVVSSKAWTPYMGPMGECASQLLARVAEGMKMERTAKALRELVYYPLQSYRVAAGPRGKVVLTDLWNDEHVVANNKFNEKPDTEYVKSCITALVWFDGAWEVNGMAMFSPEPIKEDAVGMLTDASIGLPRTKESVQKLIERNNGKRVFCLRNFKQVSEIMGCPTNGDLSETPKNILLMLSETAGPVLAPDMAQFISSPENKLYRKRASAKDAFSLFMEVQVPDDLAQYIVEHKLLADARIHTSQSKELGHLLIQDNLRFLCGFFRSV